MRRRLTAEAVGLAYWDIEAAESRKRIRSGRISVAPDGAFGDGALLPTAHAVGYALPPLRGLRLAVPSITS
jgi:hypothetical protein